MRTALAATTAVLLSVALSACGQSAADKALDYCLKGAKQVVQDNPSEYDTPEKVEEAANVCYDLYENDPETLIEHFGE